MINFKSLREARLDPVDYTVGSEKGPKGGFRAQVKHTKKGHTMYLGGKMFKSAKDAEGHAKAYLDGYAASGDRGASRAADVYVDKNKSKLVKEDVELDEAFSSFAVPVPSQTLNGKKIGGGKTPIIVKARTAREAIQKAAKQLGVDFKFLKTGKVVKEGLEESIDEAGPTYIDGVKYQKEKKKKGFNKDDWEWNSSKQLYKKVDEAFLDSLREGLSIDESMDDTIKRLKKMGGVVYGDKLTSKSDKTPAKLASQSRGKKTVYFVVTDDGYTEYKDLGAVKKAWTIAGNNNDAKIALDLMSKQGDGDAIDMILNKYKISIDKLDKIVKNNLGAKSAADFLGEAVALDEAFLRLPGEMINGELPMAIRDLESILKGLKAGNDFDAKGFNKQMARLTAVKKAAKKFNSEDEVPTRYNYTKK